MVASLLLPEGQVQAIKRNISLGGDCKLFFKEALVKWESTRCKPYTWGTILDVLSAPVVDHKVLADRIARTLRDKNNAASQQSSNSALNGAVTAQCAHGQIHGQQGDASKECGSSMYIDFKIGDEINRLKMNFISLRIEVKEALRKVPLYKLQAVVTETFEDTFKEQSPTFDMIFDKISNNSCYLNYSFLKNIVDTFQKSTPLHQKCVDYSTEVERFMESTALSSLKQEVVKRIYTGKNVELKVSSRWSSVTIKQFEKLLQIIFDHKYLTHMTVTEGCLCITWAITDAISASTIVTKWAYDEGFMRAIGILHLIVGDNVIYETLEQEDTPIALDQALLAALEAGPISAVELFLAIVVEGNPKSSNYSILPSIISRAAELRDREGSVLLFACYWGHYDVAMLLIRENANPNTEHNGYTSLMMASYKGYSKIVELLVNAKADVNAQADDGTTALYLACCYGRVKIAITLLNANANPSMAKNDGCTPLMVATEKGYNDIVKLLANAKADVNAQADDGATALYIACQNGNIQTALILLNANADPSIARKDGWTPLMAASKYGHTDIVVELLADAKVDVNAQNSNGLTALYASSCTGHLKIVSALLNANADSSITMSGWTPLMVATYWEHSDIVELLVNAKADVNAQNYNGVSALHLACKHGYSKIISILLDSNANPNIARSDGYTPLMIASSMGDIDTILLLKQYNADANYSTVTGETALSCASDDNVFQILLDCGADINMLQQPSQPVDLEQVPKISHQQLPWTIEESSVSLADIAHPLLQHEPKHDDTSSFSQEADMDIM